MRACTAVCSDESRLIYGLEPTMHEMVDGGYVLAPDYGTSVAMEKTLMESSANTIGTVSLLVGAAQSDTIDRDVYLRRARDLLSSTLDQSHYRAIGSIQKEISVEATLVTAFTRDLQWCGALA